MERRKFLRLLGAVAAAKAAAPILPAQDWRELWQPADLIYAAPGAPVVIRAVIGQYADYGSWDWDIGDGFLDKSVPE